MEDQQVFTLDPLTEEAMHLEGISPEDIQEV